MIDFENKHEIWRELTTRRVDNGRDVVRVTAREHGHAHCGQFGTQQCANKSENYVMNYNTVQISRCVKVFTNCVDNISSKLVTYY